MKAWRSFVFGEPVIVPAMTRGAARYRLWSSGTEMGFAPKFGDFRVTRAPEYDEWAQTAKSDACVIESYVKDDIARAEGKGAKK